MFPQALISALFNRGVDVHVALPDYRALFKEQLAPFLEKEQKKIRSVMPDDRVHLAEDRAFFYLNRVYSSYGGENTKMALAFQREVINNIVPRVQPGPDSLQRLDDRTDTGHVQTGRHSLPFHHPQHPHGQMPIVPHRRPGYRCCLFLATSLLRKHGHGIRKHPQHQSGGFSGQRCVCRPLRQHGEPQISRRKSWTAGMRFVEKPLQQELSNKWHADCATGILNAPDPAYNPGNR